MYTRTCMHAGANTHMHTIMHVHTQPAHRHPEVPSKYGNQQLDSSKINLR